MNATSSETATPAHEAPLPELARQLASDGVSLARAEFLLATKRLAPKLAAARIAVALIVGAAILTMLATIALIVGLVMQLATLVGPGFAGLIICGAGLLIAGAMGIAGSRRLSRIFRNLLEGWK